MNAITAMFLAASPPLWGHVTHLPQLQRVDEYTTLHLRIAIAGHVIMLNLVDVSL
jgi:hypothetical protein